MASNLTSCTFEIVSSPVEADVMALINQEGNFQFHLDINEVVINDTMERLLAKQWYGFKTQITRHQNTYMVARLASTNEIVMYAKLLIIDNYIVPWTYIRSIEHVGWDDPSTNFMTDHFQFLKDSGYTGMRIPISNIPARAHIMAYYENLDLFVPFLSRNVEKSKPRIKVYDFV